MVTTVTEVTIPGLRKRASGKVREVFELQDALLIVATDRVSAYDSVMPTGIPHKGKVLNLLSAFWFQHLRPLTVHHVISTDTRFIIEWIEASGGSVSAELAQQLDGRSLLAVDAKIVPIECVVRGYLAGSLWAEYCAEGGPQRGATLHGIQLPAGLREADALPEPVFTPATKAASGHDINIGFGEMAAIVGEETARQMADVSLRIYRRAAEIARGRGIIIADTKFEFGFHNGVLVLADEALTPDSSRFWDASAYAPGSGQASFDKQYLRDWLVASGWDKEPPAPELPPDVVEGTSARYLDAFARLTGHPLEA
jgi:phosphoribosylaminoimidazole-succinocarboxamide synthase